MSTPLQDLVSSFAHRPISDGLYVSSFPSRFLKRVYWEEVSTPLQRAFHSPPNLCRISQSTPFKAQHPRRHLFLSPIDVEPLVPPPFEVQRPCWHSISCPPPSGLSLPLAHHPVSISSTICNSSSSPLADIVLFGLSLSSYPSRFLKRVC